MSRLGGDDYARINELYTLPRPPGTVGGAAGPEMRIGG